MNNKTQRKLRLRRETVSALNSETLTQVAGGVNVYSPTALTCHNCLTRDNACRTLPPVKVSLTCPTTSVTC